MIIIFEGYNCTGKTPYVKRMSELYGLKILDYGLTDNPIMPQEDIDKMSIIENALMSNIISTIKMEDFIVDRMYASGFVYSSLKRSFRFTETFCKKIEDRLSNGMNPICHIYLTCKDRKELIKRREENNEKFTNIGDIDGEIKYYDYFFHRFTSIPYIEIDTSIRSDIDNNIKYIWERVMVDG